MNSKPVTISFLGVDERSRSAYQLFFENNKPARYELIDDYREAQLCLVDKDAYNIQQQYEKLIHSYPEKYILVLSIVENSCSHDKEFFLQKPVKRDIFQKLLNEIYTLISGTAASESNTPTSSQIKKTVAKISQKYIKQKGPVKPATKLKDNKVVSIKKARKVSIANAGKLLKIEHEEYFVGDRPDIDLNNPELLKKVFYAPKMLLQAVMEQACVKSQQSEQVVQLNVLDNVFYFDYKEQNVYSSVGPSVIRPLCVIQHENQVSYGVKHSSFRDDLNFIIKSRENKTANSGQKNHIWSMQAFMWLITLWCSRGRVPQGIDLVRPVYLMQWPNLTRLEPIPHAARIAALIYEQPRTLPDVAKQLGIEQRYVFAFFSACRSIGLSDISQRGVDRLFATEKPKSHKNTFILSKLLGRLVNFSNKDSMNETA